jgi:UDP-N-acetylmuramate dehydrogenase
VTEGLAQLLGDALQTKQPLARYTAARLGGPADGLWVTATDTPPEHLIAVIRQAWADGWPVRVIGAGANILVSDRGVRGLVIVNRASGVEPAAGAQGLRVASGTGLIALARQCQKRGLRGLEWAIGVPGTLGGALVNNAGAHGGDMAAITQDARCLTQTGEVTLHAADLAFRYRGSALKDAAAPVIVIEATITLEADDPEAIAARMEHYTQLRRQSQPPGASLGSVFKNPAGDYAGRLIEAAGLKGFRSGGVEVSRVHANFFVSDASATAADYDAVIRHVRDHVLAHGGVQLETEIEYVGDW